VVMDLVDAHDLDRRAERIARRHPRQRWDTGQCLAHTRNRKTRCGSPAGNTGQWSAASVANLAWLATRNLQLAVAIGSIRFRLPLSPRNLLDALRKYLFVFSVKRAFSRPTYRVCIPDRSASPRFELK
jgi:hypothetical protein